MIQQKDNSKLTNWEIVSVNPNDKDWNWKDLFCFWGSGIQSIIGFSLITSLYLMYQLNILIVFFWVCIRIHIYLFLFKFNRSFLNNFIIIEIGVTTPKNTKPIIIGETNLPSNIPNLVQIIFKGVSIDALINPKNKKIVDIIMDQILYGSP